MLARNATTQHPRLDLGLFIIPAWLLPLLFTSTFLWLTFHVQHRKICLVKARRFLSYPLFTLRVMILYRVVATTSELVSKREIRNHIIFLEYLALVLDYSFIQQADSQACVATAWAWLVLMNLSPDDAQTYTKAQLAVAQMVPLLVVGSVRFEGGNAGLLISGVSLLALMMEYTIIRNELFPFVPTIFLAGVVCMLGCCTIRTVFQPLYSGIYCADACTHSARPMARGKRAHVTDFG